MRECGCGCKQEVVSPDKRGRERFFCRGHRLRGLKRMSLSNETKAKISIALRGNKNGRGNKGKMGGIPWNKNKKTGIAPWQGKKRPEVSAQLKKRWLEGKMPVNRIVGEETRKLISESKKGSLNHFWNGGITPISVQIRKSREYKIWRKTVFEKDDYICQSCSRKGGKLHADHIKPFFLFKELRLEISNGRTLCVDCHRQTETYGNKLYFQLKKGIGSCLE